jgi:hypothetical protein
MGRQLRVGSGQNKVFEPLLVALSPTIRGAGLLLVIVLVQVPVGLQAIHAAVVTQVLGDFVPEADHALH